MAQEIGADFRHQAGRRGDYAIAEINGAGCALIDVDNDGDLDLFLVQGGATQTSANGELVPSDAVLLNNLIGSQGKSQDLQFSPAPGNAGVVESGYGFGAATGDFDNDGRTDLLVTNLGPNRLWRNRGDGTFEDVTVAAGLQQDRWSVSASFIDFDSDGWLDLYVGNYLTLAPGENKLCRTTAGAPDYCGPSAYPGAGDQVWRNRGDGTFEDVSLATGIGRPRGRSLGVVSGDFNQDGRPDLLVANDQESNFLWLNQDGTTFLDEAVLAGVAVNREGRVEASMGADAADMDNDGDEDLFLTHLVTETNTLYLNEGAGMFEDATARLGLGVPSLRSTSWGTRAFDFDNDGRLDLFSANGAVRVIESLAAEGDPNPFHEPNQLFRNLGAAGFEDDSANGGPGFELSEVSRGAAFGDLDNDGDTDIVVTQNDGPVRILINNVGQERPWLGLRVVGRATRQATSRPRDMYGAWVVLEQAGRPTQWRRVRHRRQLRLGQRSPHPLWTGCLSAPFGENTSLRDRAVA